MASKYGEVFDIYNTHHVETKAKLDALLAKNTEIAVNNDGVESLLTDGNSSHSSIDGKMVTCNTGACVVASSALPSGASSEAKQDANNASIASVDGKIVACNTGACVVTSSALPSGASDSAKQDEIKSLITATNTALAGTLTVSSPAMSKSSSSPVSNEAINGQSVYLSSEFDISSSRHISLIGSSSDTSNSHEVDLLVSNVSGGTYFKTSHSGYFLNGDFHLLVTNVPYKYIKVQVKNGDYAVENSADFSIHLLESN
jgi:outer membrane murein-binding lipoprotein Lpp